MVRWRKCSISAYFNASFSAKTAPRGVIPQGEKVTTNRTFNTVVLKLHTIERSKNPVNTGKNEKLKKTIVFVVV